MTKRIADYRWNLRTVMASHNLWKTTQLAPLLAERGVNLSPAQIYRLVTEQPERLSLRTFELELALERMATLDSLSGARTRGSFIELAQAEIARSGRTGAPLSLLLLDIDKFKSINDTWGHPAGDAVIRSLADTARSVLRSSDVLGRIGGEEFAILLPGSDVRTAHAIADQVEERLKQDLQLHEVTVHIEPC